MPTIATLVADLVSGAVVGIGAKIDSSLPAGSAPLSMGHAIKYFHDDMTAALSASSRLSFPAAASAVAANGRYLHYQDNWTTVCRLDVHQPLVVSGNFSGCAYKVYKTNAAEIICAHIARPGGTSSDANVTLMGDYAAQKNWTELQSIATTGQIGSGGCTEVILVSQLIANRVDTVRLNVSNSGLIVGTQLTSTAIPP